MINSLAHIEVNVKDIKRTKAFYDIISYLIGRSAFIVDKNTIGYKAPDNTHIFFVKAGIKYTNDSFHRKNIGLNHIAFRVETKKQVNDIANYLEKNNIPLLYTDRKRDYSHEYNMKEYYAIFFEDPDRIKLEIVYCK